MVNAADDFSNLSMETNSVLNLTNLTLNDDQYKYRCIVNSDCGKDTSAIVILIVNCATSAPAQPAQIYGPATAVCQNSTILYTVTPVKGATSYTWTIPSGWTGTSLGRKSRAVNMHRNQRCN